MNRVCEVCEGIGRVKVIDGSIVGPATGFEPPEAVINCPSCAGTSPNKPEPPPEKNDSRPIWELVVEDMNERHQEGIRKYGVPLQANNGRKPLIDAYQEALDLAVYLRQAIEEQKRKPDGFFDAIEEHSLRPSSEDSHQLHPPSTGRWASLYVDRKIEKQMSLNGFTFETHVNDDDVPYADIFFDGKLVGRTMGKSDVVVTKVITIEDKGPHAWAESAPEGMTIGDGGDIPQAAKDKGWAAVGCTECGGPAPAEDMAELYAFDGKCRACYEKAQENA